MGAWEFTRTATSGGRFLIAITKLTPGGRRTDVTLVRDTPTLIESLSSADPFGDSTAQLSFPAITAFDDLTATDLTRWLGYYSDVDVYWSPAIDPGAGRYPPSERVIDPITEQPGLVAPYRLRDGAGRPGDIHAVKVWEGFVAAMDFSVDRGLRVQCQGALFQIDRYLSKPFYPARPWPLERLIAEQFDHSSRPHLRTAPLAVEWPEDWVRVVPDYEKDSANAYTPVAKPGTKWTGYTSRDTGSWDHALTGFVQDQLSVMITRAGDGVDTGNQWTIDHRRAGASSAGREPVLRVRDRFAEPDFSIWLGTPGVTVQLSGDSTQSENLIYGSGTDVHGTKWRNASISDDGSRTSYKPLAAAPEVYPYSDNPALVSGGFVSEANTKFGSGFAFDDAMDVAKQSLARDRQPGWTGTVEIASDPSAEMSRWQIRAGMVMRLRGFLGSGKRGVLFHVSSVTANPEAGTVQCTVDTRFRDLLTVQEAIERTRDPLTPVKMLQVNRSSVVIPDIQAPWDYSAGSGYIPRKSKAFHDYCPSKQPFPYEDWAMKHPPQNYGQWYVRCDAGAPLRKDRWAGPIPVLTSERGDIARTEIACYDLYGRLLKIPFHVSFYYLKVSPSAMPRDAGGPSPYIDNAFESINPETGQPWPKGNYLDAPDSMIIGWGNRQDGTYNRAGFSPGSEADGDSPTGMLMDDSTWHYDNTTSGNRDYVAQAKPGYVQSDSAISLYAMFYAEYLESVYFMGRIYKANIGTNV